MYHTALLGSGSEWPKDEALLLTMMPSYLKKNQNMNIKEKKLLWTNEDGDVDRIVIDWRHNQSGRMADFSPFLTFQFLTYKHLI